MEHKEMIMPTIKRFILIGTIIMLTACSAPFASPTVTLQPSTPTSTSQPLTPTITIHPPTPTISLPTPTINPKFAALTQNHQKWDALKITHYRFKLEIGCFCSFNDDLPFSIEVLDDKVVSMLDNKGQPVIDNFDTYNTIEKLFNQIDDAFKQKADEINVEYNPENGFPQLIEINYSYTVYDDEMGFRVTDFTTLP